MIGDRLQSETDTLALKAMQRLTRHGANKKLGALAHCLAVPLSSQAIFLLNNAWLTSLSQG